MNNDQDTPTQNEIDALMSAARGEGDTGDSDFEEPEDQKPSIESYDLTRHDRVIHARYPLLDLMHEIAGKEFTEDLSFMLQVPISFISSSSSLMKLSEFFSYLATPICISMIKLPPLPGASLIVYSPDIVLATIHRMFGGRLDGDPEDWSVDRRELTTLEWRVSRRISEMMLDGIRKGWKTVTDLNPTYLRHVSDPRHAGIASPSEVVAVTTFEVECYQLQVKIQLAIPYSSLEPFRSRLGHASLDADEKARQTWKESLTSALLQVPVDINVELGQTKDTLTNISKWETGTLLRLNSSRHSQLDIEIAGIKKLKGLPLNSNGNLAVEVSSFITHTNENIEFPPPFDASNGSHLQNPQQSINKQPTDSTRPDDKNGQSTVNVEA